MPNYVPLGRFKVTYLDGRVEEVRSNFAAIMDLEAELPEAATPDGTVLARGVWLYLDRPQGDLRKWAAGVWLIEPMPIEAGEADPSPPVAGAD